MILFGFGWFPELTKSAASVPFNLASPINAGAVTMILSIAVVPVVSLFTKKPDEKMMDEVSYRYTDGCNVLTMKKHIK